MINVLGISAMRAPETSQASANESVRAAIRNEIDSLRSIIAQTRAAVTDPTVETFLEGLESQIAAYEYGAHQ